MRILFYFETRTALNDVVAITIDGAGLIPVYLGADYTNVALQNTTSVGAQISQAGQLVCMFWDGDEWEYDPYFTDFNNSTKFEVTNMAINPVAGDTAADNITGAGGSLTITAGDVGGGNFTPGTLLLRAGNLTGSATGVGGQIGLLGGDGATVDYVDSGICTLRGGNTTSSAARAGTVQITGGSGVNSSGGQVRIGGGPSGSSAITGAGNVQINGGAGGPTGDPTGGAVIISAGQLVDSSYGLVVILNLPTSDPGYSGALWNSSGTLKISP